MTVARLIPEFDTPAAGAGPAAGADPGAGGAPAPDPDRSYDEGYSSGWEDAVRAAEERGERISAEFERMIQDLGFSYHEALDQLRGQFLEALTGFLEALLPNALPELVRAHIDAALSAQSEAPPPIELVVSAQQLELFRPMVDRETRLTIDLTAEESLGPDQAFIRISGQQSLIDFGPIVEGFREQICALGAPREEEMRDAG